MAHFRKRHLSQLLEGSLKFSPIVGLLGHRQVGKTTVAEKLAETYLTLDSQTDLALALSDAPAFLAQHSADPLAIDECQYAPPLFPALKEWVRTRKRPGQFLLTGSVRFSSRKAIRESLTGRIISWELLPMDWAEQHHQSLPKVLPQLLKKINAPLTPNPHFNVSTYRNYLTMGGLPGVFGVRDRTIRAQRFETQINTILERDLKLLLQTTLPYRTLRKLFGALARQVGAPLEMTVLAKETRISLPTLRKLLAAFEALFLIRTLPCEGDYSKPLVFFEDVGEYSFISPGPVDEGKLLLSFLYQNLRTQVHYRPDLQIESFCFRARSGFEVPLCYRDSEGRILGIIPFVEDIEEANRNARAFLNRYSKASVLITGVGDKDEFIGRNIRWVGVGRLL